MQLQSVSINITIIIKQHKCMNIRIFQVHCSINGVPACANKKLLTDILRDEWGFRGYVISDEGAIEDIMDSHKYTNNTADTATVAVNAGKAHSSHTNVLFIVLTVYTGCNIEDGPAGREPYYNAITEAVKLGKLSIDKVRESVKPLFYTRMRLGLFDPEESNPYAQLDPAVVVQSAEHRELSITAAMRTFVLLKNNGVLPLDKAKVFDSVAVGLDFSS